MNVSRRFRAVRHYGDRPLSVEAISQPLRTNRNRSLGPEEPIIASRAETLTEIADLHYYGKLHHISIRDVLGAYGCLWVHNNQQHKQIPQSKIPHVPCREATKLYTTISMECNIDTRKPGRL